MNDTVQIEEYEGCYLERERDDWALLGPDGELWAVGVVIDSIDNGRIRKAIRGKRTESCPLSGFEVRMHVSVLLGINVVSAQATLESIRRAKEIGFWPCDR